MTTTSSLVAAARRSPTVGAAASGARRALAVALLLAGAAPALASTGTDSPHGELSIGCEACHTPEGWRPLRLPLDFDHATTGFPLVGGHEVAACATCHRDLVFAHVPTACADCHADPHRGELGVECSTCHAPVTWENRATVFELHQASLFPLTGVHATVDCAACHQEAPPFEYQVTPTDCVSCHRADFEGASEPDHVAAGFPTSCELCHDTITFEQAIFAGGIDFDHDALFPLSGAHGGLDCSDCHAGGFAGTQSECYSCHRAEYEATTDPDHVAAGFPTTCELCHQPTQWEDAEFDHAQFFPLTGAHRNLECEDCHAGGFAGTPSDCYGCHRADYEATDDPDHVAGGFPTACEACHTTADWEDAELDHDQFFPLTGAHRNLECEACHADGFGGESSECFSCHRADYNGTTDPDHQAEGFPTQCEGCHTTSGWEGAEFDHSQFPLTGAHRNLECEACHADGFGGESGECYSCHRDDYDATTDPNHVEAGFPTTCEVCHGTNRWEGAEFDHAQFFPLTGAHRNLDCELCHADGYDGTPTDCYSCHRDDYDGTTNPDHEAAGFPIECQLCHTTNQWEGAEFDHDGLYFPIYSGSHQGEWDECADCHVDPDDFSVFECTTCHQQGETDDEHEDVPGYVYESNACYDCHPTGEE